MREIDCRAVCMWAPQSQAANESIGLLCHRTAPYSAHTSHPFTIHRQTAAANTPKWRLTDWLNPWPGSETGTREAQMYRAQTVGPVTRPGTTPCFLISFTPYQSHQADLGPHQINKINQQMSINLPLCFYSRRLQAESESNSTLHKQTSVILVHYQ